MCIFSKSGSNDRARCAALLNPGHGAQIQLAFGLRPIMAFKTFRLEQRANDGFERSLVGSSFIVASDVRTRDLACPGQAEHDA